MPDTVACSDNRVITDYYFHNSCRTANGHLIIIFSAQFWAIRMFLDFLSSQRRQSFHYIYYC